MLPYQRHQKTRQFQQKQNQSLQSNLVKLLDKPFYIRDRKEHLKLAIESNQNCCFNHIVGLPTKGGREFPLFDYQKLIFDTLMSESGSFKDKHLYLLKSTGIGASELFLRLMAWLCTKDDDTKRRLYLPMP